MKNKIVILSSFIFLLIVNNATAFNATQNLGAIELYPNIPKQFCNLTINTSENESVGNINLMFSGLPIDIKYYPLPTSLYNQSYTTCLNITVPNFVAPSTYLETIYVNSNISTIFVPINLTVLQSSNWSILTDMSFNLTVNTGDSQVTPIILRNDGNTVTEIVTTIVGNATNISSVTNNLLCYPSLNCSMSLQILIPKSFPRGNYFGDIYIATKNGAIDAVQHINYSLTIIDNIPPIVYSISIPEIMATKAVILSVQTDDNLKVQNVLANISHNETSSELYPVIINSTTNETVWETRYFNKTITDIADLTLQNIPNTNIYSATFDKTNVITTYFIDITTIDSSNNSVTNRTQFEVKPLNVMINYTSFIVLKSLKRPYGFMYESDYGTPLTLTLKNVSYAGNFSFEIYDAGGNLRGMMNAIDQSILLQDTGAHYLKLIGDAASDRRGEDTYGYFNAIFGWSAIPQHVPIPDLTVSGTVINYTLSMPFNGTVDTQRAQCTPYDTGDFATSYVQCIMQFPPEVGPDDMIWPVTIKERADAEALKKQMNDRINGLEFQKTIAFLFVIMAIIFPLVYYRIIHPELRDNVG